MFNGMTSISAVFNNRTIKHYLTYMVTILIAPFKSTMLFIY